VLKNYLEGDTESLEYAVLLEWNNIYYDDSPKLINTTKAWFDLINTMANAFLTNLDALLTKPNFH
jgi:hypothetical protein